MSTELKANASPVYVGRDGLQHKLKLFSHQRISNKKAARWRLLSEYQGVASH
jgi:hypothetical protein